MDENKLIADCGGKSKSEMKEMMINMFSGMTPERFFEHMDNMREMARQSGQENEREELVCRLLASGMSAEEIAIVLCVKVEAVRIIEHNYAANKIPEYVKKLRERRRCRERQAAV